MIRSLAIRLGLLIVVASILLTSCAGGQYLRTKAAGSLDISGSYTLILYGCNYTADVENAAILVPEGAPYTFEVYAPNFDYQVQKRVPAREALREAERFVSCHYAFWRSRISKIIDPEGNIAGYEVRPLYREPEFRYPDILDISYPVEGRTVKVMISLKSGIRRPAAESDMPFLFRRRR
jgi:hypothetical protein